ncbi:MAG: ABC transporter ATP-binding protein [Bacteroidota bacterium]|nr:ABC transporter ATP-binding protein [Bacteroidota bacterium]
MLLEAKSLAIGYTAEQKRSIIHNDISLSFQKGVFTSILGANGVGKSTLIKTLTGFIPPLQGEVLIEGKELSTYNLVQLSQKMSIVLTEKLPPSNLTVKEILALARQPYTNWLGRLTAEDKQLIDYSVEQVQLKELLNKKYYQLSDGQFQKVMIARALVQDTPIIILDEPTTYLDLQNKFAIFEILLGLKKNSNKCIILSTHDLDLALEYSERLVVMTSNQIVSDTTPNCIERGVLDTLFTDTKIKFDSSQKKFIYNR